ncbi:MAG: DNA-processing protein DprA [bacterium]
MRQVGEALRLWEHFLALKPDALRERFACLPEPARSALAAARAGAESFRPDPNYLSFLDPDFPDALRALYDPPHGLYLRGSRQALGLPRPWIAVVGTRRASSYALNHCAQLIQEMKDFSPVIVSGLALGIDGMAHRAALAEGLATFGVLGSSVEDIYPARHRPLARAMLREGLLLSEVPAGMEVAPWNFPKRNRIIAALADVVVVVEAPEKSGALLTADFALELGKEIYVVPGPADSDRNRGGHRLIQQGAKLLMEAREIFVDLGLASPLEVKAKAPTVPSGETAPVLEEGLAKMGDCERKLLEIIGFTPCHIDKITDMSHLPSPRVTGLLVQLGLQGLVEALPGNYFQLRPLGREWLSKPE